MAPDERAFCARLVQAFRSLGDVALGDQRVIRLVFPRTLGDHLVLTRDGFQHLRAVKIRIDIDLLFLHEGFDARFFIGRERGIAARPPCGQELVPAEAEIDGRSLRIRRHDALPDE
ncbi:MAG: hypothetical protein HY543_06690 [Deltaproteobacteria bacterium]|nr:hypothetical protein [Deltaproteobacteria bacterium]